MHDFFTGHRPWAQLERLIARLPRHSHYKAALEDDENYARVAFAVHPPDDNEPPARTPLVGYDDTIARLDNVFDAINAVNETLITVYSRRGSKPKPIRAERPESAYARVRRQLARSKLDSIVDRMTGGR